jgi:hypothetical protein
VDVKKQGRIPDGGGWRPHGRGSAQDRATGGVRDRAKRRGTTGSRGYRFLHHAVDDFSRLAYSEVLDDERKTTAAGITVEQVMTGCPLSLLFKEPVGDTYPS